MLIRELFDMGSCRAAKTIPEVKLSTNKNHKSDHLLMLAKFLTIEQTTAS